MFNTLHRDSAMSRPAMADYVLIFRKPGENQVAIQSDVSNEEWIEWARPVWLGIRESDTLNFRTARDDADERHIAPLQLGLIERCVRLWSNASELVLSPFAGIGSEGVVCVRQGRRFVGCELKPSYWKTAVRNLTEEEGQLSLLESAA
jgi:DNA modification methylase